MYQEVSRASTVRVVEITPEREYMIVMEFSTAP